MDIGLDLPIDDPSEAFARVVRAVERGAFQARWRSRTSSTTLTAARAPDGRMRKGGAPRT
jgi:hypothetical protein